MEESKLIDDCFYVKERKWGTWDSYNKEGKCLITSLTEESCINATRFYLKGLQEGFGEVNTHQGTVDGKL
jgi:hypothetical protein